MMSASIIDAICVSAHQLDYLQEREVIHRNRVQQCGDEQQNTIVPTVLSPKWHDRREVRCHDNVWMHTPEEQWEITDFLAQ